MDLIICKELIKNNISYGKVVTYSDIAIEIASRRGIKNKIGLLKLEKNNISKYR